MTRFHEVAPAVPASVGQLRNAVAGFARDVGAGDELVRSMQLAVSEAMSNAVVHAYVDSAAPGTLSVTAFVQDGGFCVVVSDDGAGMRPRPDSPGLGVGLPLMTQMSESLEFRVNDAGGTEVAMRFALS